VMTKIGSRCEVGDFPAETIWMPEQKAPTQLENHQRFAMT
jgi:hypothetical protein